MTQSTSWEFLVLLKFRNSDVVLFHWHGFVIVRQPVELKRYQIPPDLMRILPSTPQTRSKRGGGEQIGPNHFNFVLVGFLIMLFDLIFYIVLYCIIFLL